jgi:hypothetical protein
MGQAIRYTCSHCRRELFFDSRVVLSLDSLSSLACSECGENGAVLTLSVDAPPGTELLDALPTREHLGQAD